MSYRAVKIRISGTQTNPRGLGIFEPHKGAGLCFLLQFRKVIIADVKHSGLGVFLVKDCLPSAELQQCQAGPVPLQGVNKQRALRVVPDTVGNSPQHHFPSALAPRICPGPPGNAPANTQAEDMSSRFFHLNLVFIIQLFPQILWLCQEVFREERFPLRPGLTFGHILFLEMFLGRSCPSLTTPALKAALQHSRTKHNSRMCPSSLPRGLRIPQNSSPSLQMFLDRFLASISVNQATPDCSEIFWIKTFP